MNSLRFAGLTALSATLGAASPVFADQWFVEPEASLRVLYDDNTRLRVDDEIDSAGMVARAAVTAGKRSENSELGVQSALERRVFASDSDRNSTDLTLDLFGSKVLERDRFDVSLELDADSTLTSELEASGFVDERKRRERLSLTPSWQHNVSERFVLTTSAGLSDVHYRDAALTPLVDYSYTTLGVSGNYGLSPQTSLLGGIDLSDYDPERGLDSTRSIGMIFGASHVFSEQWSLSAQGGLRRSESGVDSDTGTLIDILASRQFELDRVEFGANYSLLPSGTGELLDSQRVFVNWRHPISSRLIFRLNAQRRDNENATSSTAGRGDRRYVSIEPRLRYSIDREWALIGGYRYREQDYELQPGDTDSNMLFVELRYRALSER